MLDGRYEALKEEISREKLVSDPRIPGKFIKRAHKSSDGIGHLAPNNWVFHDQIVEKVLEGKYNEINPVCSEFVTTLNCSNRCGFCGYKLAKLLEGCWAKNNFRDEDVHMQSLDGARNFLDYLVDGGIKGLIFTGGGEPFLFQGLEDLVAHANLRDTDSVVYTNGNAVSERRLLKLLESPPLLARVSLNAGTEEVYDKIHSPLSKGSFNRCLRTIKTLAEGSLRNPSMDLGVGVVINNINKNDLTNVAIRLKEITDKTGGGIRFVTFRPEFDYYNSEQLSSELLDSTHEIVETKVRKILEGTGINVSNVSCRYEALKRDTRNYSVCRAAGFLAEACPGEKLFFCCDRNLNRKYFIGQRGQGLREVHHGPGRQKILDYVNSSDCEVCPPACKSHETNIQFQEIENLRARGEMYLVSLWIEEQRKMPKPKMVNFL